MMPSVVEIFVVQMHFSLSLSLDMYIDIYIYICVYTEMNMNRRAHEIE